MQQDVKGRREKWCSKLPQEKTRIGLDWSVQNIRKNIKSTKQQGTLASYGHEHLTASSASRSCYKPTTHKSLGIMIQRSPCLLEHQKFKRLKHLSEEICYFSDELSCCFTLYNRLFLVSCAFYITRVTKTKKKHTVSHKCK